MMNAGRSNNAGLEWLGGRKVQPVGRADRGPRLRFGGGRETGAGAGNAKALLLLGFLLGMPWGVNAAVVLNEVMADNKFTIVNGGDSPDWVEIMNTGPGVADLGGMSLSDDVAVPRKYIFPAGTRLQAGEKLVVWCDTEDDAPGLHTGFGLSATGQRITLYGSGQVPWVADALTCGLQATDWSVGRVPDGTGAWGLCKPTPWAANQTQVAGAQTALRINEWMASPSSGDDWFELFNPLDVPVALGGLSLTDSAATPGLSPIPALSFIGPEGFQLFWADGNTDQGADHANFKLSAGGESIGLYRGAERLDAVSFATQAPGASEGRLPDGGNTVVRFSRTDTPGDSNYLPLESVVINELLAHTDPPYEDAVEVYNTTVAAIDISGWYLSNSKTRPKKYRIPDGTVVGAGQYRVFYEGQFNADEGDPNAFNFNSAHGGDVVLSEYRQGVQTGYRAVQGFPATANGVSMGRVATSVGFDFAVLTAMTFGVDAPSSVIEFRQGQGARNAVPQVGPVVLTEILYHPRSASGGADVDNTLDEFLELKNVSTGNVPLYDPQQPGNTWRLRNGVDFNFPAGVGLKPGGILLVVSFDPVVNPAVLASFRQRFAVPASVPVLGPWSGKLDNGGETLELLAPDQPQLPPHPDAGFVPYVRVERIRYADTLPWPVSPDGTGTSLQRRNGTAFGNDVANWAAAEPTAGTDPTASDPIEITSVRVSGSSVVIAFGATRGRSYRVQGSGSVTGSDGWTLVKEFSAVTQDQTLEASDPIGGVGASRFYRVTSP